MKKARTKASAAAAAEMLGTAGGGGFGGGFGAAFGSAFTGFGVPAVAAAAAAATEEESGAAPSTAPAASAAALSASSSASTSTDSWAAFMQARVHEAPEVTDATLVLALKQLQKRDPITRLKALDALSQAFSAMAVGEAIHILPAWLLAQERLHLDNDRRVREAVWACFGLLRAKAAKQFAPHLKAAFPLWWTNQSDPCKEVAKAAANEWNTAFPARAKQIQAAIYCHREYISYCASLFAHTPATLSDATIYSPEESQDRWERATSSAIASIAEYVELTCTPAEGGEATATAAASLASSISLDAYNSLLPSSVLRKFATCKTVHIRRALYTLLKSLVLFDPAGYVTRNLDTLAPLIVCDLLDEMDRTNHQAMFDCVLSFLRKHADAAWAVLQRPMKGGSTLVAASFSPRLKKLLQTGLNGNYNVVYPCVLPLLSFIPDSVMLLVPGSSSSLESFYAFFFTSLWSARTTLQDAGGAALSLQGQSKELLALIDAYMECLVYSVKKRTAQRDLQKTLVSQHLLTSVLALALHFACPGVSPTTDPSVTAEAVASNRFGASLFERAGRALRDATSLLHAEDAATVWQQLSKACVAALETGSTYNVSEVPNAAPTLTQSTSAPHSSKRLHAAVAQPIDESLAVGVVLTQQSRENLEPHGPFLSVVVTVFQLALEQFTKKLFASFASLQLAVQLAEAFTLRSILAAAPTPIALAPFLSTSLLPVLRQLLTAASNASDADASAASMHAAYIDTVELFARGLLARTIDELGADESIGASVWEELLDLLTSTSVTAGASVAASKLHLALLRILFTFVFSKCPSVYGHAALQDLIVTQAEQLLTCERPELLSEYVGILSAILTTPGLLAQDVLAALLASFLDAVESFQRQEDDLMLTARAVDSDQTSTSDAFVRRFEADTGCKIHALPSLLVLLGSLLAPGALEVVSASVADAAQMRAQIVKCAFWLQHSPRGDVAAQATHVWERQVDRAALAKDPAVLLELASVFRQRVLQASLATFTSAFIVAWAAWLKQLFEAATQPHVQHQTLDAALPSHDDLQQMLACVDPSGAAVSLQDVAERVRVVRDLLGELPSTTEHGLTERVLFLGEASTSASAFEVQPRLTLLLDLFAIDHFLGAFEKGPDVSILRQARGSLALDLEEVQEAQSSRVLDQLREYIESGTVSSAQLVTLVQTALTESQAIGKESSSARAANAGRSYAGALRTLLSFQAVTSNVEVRRLLVGFLAQVQVDQIRTHAHTVLSESFEATLVAVLESQCLTASAKDTANVVANLMKWTQDGFDAGVRLLAKQNERLFGLSSLIRIQTAILRVSDIVKHPAYEAFRTRALTAASQLNLFDPLAAGAPGFSPTATRFFHARSELLGALLSLQGAPLEAPLVQHAVLWSVSVCKYAGSQHTAAMREGASASTSASASSMTTTTTIVQSAASAAWFFEYLASTFGLMERLVPLLLPSTPTELSMQASLASALHSFVSICYPLLTTSSGTGTFGGVLSALSVKCFTRASMALEAVFRAYREMRPQKLIELVREDLRFQPAATGVDTPGACALFRLLAHPMPSYALVALHLLSVGLLERAICTPISFEVDEAEEMSHVLAAIATLQKAQTKSQKKKAAAAAAADEPNEEAEIELEHQRKTLRNEYQRKLTQQRLDQLIPYTLQHILEQRCQTNEIDIMLTENVATPNEKGLFFSHRPVALQLRGYLLTWSLVLDLLSQSLSAPTDDATSKPVRLSLSEDKSSLLITFLRESDLLTPFASEMIEHMLVSLPESTVERFILDTVKRYEHTTAEADAAAHTTAASATPVEPAVVVEDEDEEGNIIAPKPAAASASASAPVPIPTQVREFPLWHTPSMLVAHAPLSDVKVVPFTMKRLLRLRKALDQGVLHVDEEFYYGHLACLLYLRTLRVLPALSRAWFTNIDRANGTMIARLTGACFSPLLIQDELLDLMRQQALAPEPEDDEEEFLIRTNYAPETIGPKALATTPAVVFAKFTRGEIVMALALKLPVSYPLLPVAVSLDEKVAVKEALSKKWTLAITSILASADGSMFDAINVWRRNLHSHFAGVQECSICMSVISATNHSLPRMRCTECNNKFHSSCLYKWFASSGNSKCPLCRSLFSA